MERRTAMWALVAFFGATIAFQAVQHVTKDEATGVTVAAEVVVLAVIVLVIRWLVRRQSS